MPVSYTSGQTSYSRRHPTCWAWLQRSHYLSSTSCHANWTFAPLRAHLSTAWECTASQIKTPVCTHSQPPSSSSDGTIGSTALWADHRWNRIGWTTQQDPVLPSPKSAPILLEWPSKKSVCPALVAFPKAWAKKCVGPPPHQCRMFPLLLEQMGRDLFCSRWMWRRRTNCWSYFPPMSSPSTSLWTARHGFYEWWDNRSTAQHLPRGLVHASSGC